MAVSPWQRVELVAHGVDGTVQWVSVARRERQAPTTCFTAVVFRKAKPVEETLAGAVLDRDSSNKITESGNDGEFDTHDVEHNASVSEFKQGKDTADR